jgi:FAD/FMN-containing dehydrogenase
METVAAAVEALAPAFAGRLVLPTAPDYDEARSLHNGMIDKRPALVAQCRGTADAADAVKLARRLGLEIAVRGGGHNVAGRASVDGGVVVDLSLMRNVLVDPASKRAWAGGGSTWRDFNRETQLYGLATTGGVVSSTGVAGLTLGGGFGWLMPKHGMALDNVLEVEAVLADGRIVRASAAENPDLFWAMRGGGGNFGVASSFLFRLHEVGPTVTGGLIAWTADRARDVLRHFRDLAAKANDDTMLVGALLTGPDGTTKLAAMAAGCFGRAADADALVASLRSLGAPAMDALGPIPYADLNAMLDASYPRGARNYWKSHFCDELSDAAIDAIVERFMRCPSPMGQIVIENFHGAATRVAPTDTAYALRASGFNVLVLSQWMAAGDDAACTAWARETYAALQPFVSASRYLNYLDHDDAGEATLAAAYGSNVRRLQSIKAKYDPDNVFRLNVNVPPRA